MLKRYRRLFQLLPVAGLLLSFAVTVAPVAAQGGNGNGNGNGNGAPSQAGLIAVFKEMCIQVGQNNTCNGRDTSLSGYSIDFQVRAGAGATSGTVLQTITVTINQNDQGQGNLGSGSQGRTVGSTLSLGTYTVCEVESAYKSGQPNVALVATARPEPGNGGSSGGQQTLVNSRCIQVTLNGGTAELKFLDRQVVPASNVLPSPTPTTRIPGDPEPGGQPEVTPTRTPTATSTTTTTTVVQPSPTPRNRGGGGSLVNPPSGGNAPAVLAQSRPPAVVPPASGVLGEVSEPNVIASVPPVEVSGVAGAMVEAEPEELAPEVMAIEVFRLPRTGTPLPLNQIVGLFGMALTGAGLILGNRRRG